MPVNIANRLRAAAENNPGKAAVVLCKGPGSDQNYTAERYTFAQLERDSDAAARGFLETGIQRGTKTLVMLRPSLPFFSCFFALFKVGAVPVFIDPGMGGSRLLECVRVLAPEAMVGVPMAHLARVLFRRHFPDFKIAVTHGRKWLWGGRHWESIRRFTEQPFPIADTAPDEMAAILFTTGSTGPAKGVEYSHGALDQQVAILSKTFGITENDRDLATFPGFSLFSIALGMTAVVPDMNPVRPGMVHPPNVIGPLIGEGCTFSFGSPALWGRVSEFAEKNGIRLPGLKRVVMAGAPVPAAVHERLLGSVLDSDANTYTPYGATEVMPVACVGGREVLAESAPETARGRGVCVGLPAEGARVEAILIRDEPIAEWSEGLVMPEGQIGEIAVQAPYASRHYHNLPEADAVAKIVDNENGGEKFWHRMGDVGYKDAKGRIWFCGRKAHRVRARDGDMFSVCCEGVFNVHADVARTALVGVPAEDGFQKPVLAVELKPGVPEERRAAIREELLALGARVGITAGIRDILFHSGFPTDIRHNAKIRREDLAVWAAEGKQQQ